MSSKPKDDTLGQINEALKLFPKVLADQKRARIAKEKVLKRFAPMAKALGRKIEEERKKEVQVREHTRKTNVNEAHPSGQTIVQKHVRHVGNGSAKVLSGDEMDRIFATYPRMGLRYPTVGRLAKYAHADEFDELIAVWAAYFGARFGDVIDVNVIKALIASESGFQANPMNNPVAIGLIQITRPTFDLLIDENSEARGFTFNSLRFEDLAKPSVNIPLGIRWLFHKKKLAASHLKREPTSEELILQYKGLLKSKSTFKMNALKNFREAYEKLVETHTD